MVFDLRLLWFLGQVPEDILIERVVGRRLDPVTGKIYHLKYSPPETEEIAARLTQRFDDTEEKASQYSLILYMFLCFSKVFHSIITSQIITLCPIQSLNIFLSMLGKTAAEDS